MISGFQSRECGLGLGSLLIDVICQKINDKRRCQRYKSSADAMLINSNDLKNDIVDDPLLRYFHAGANKDGYWTSSHTNLQLEDAMDCISIYFLIMIMYFFMISHLVTQK